eukprot:5875343-Pleurochrysis_carterae.AAC.1
MAEHQDACRATWLYESTASSEHRNVLALHHRSTATLAKRSVAIERVARLAGQPGCAAERTPP